MKNKKEIFVSKDGKLWFSDAEFYQVEGDRNMYAQEAENYRKMLEELYTWYTGRSESFKNRANKRLWDKVKKMLGA